MLRAYIHSRVIVSLPEPFPFAHCRYIPISSSRCFATTYFDPTADTAHHAASHNQVAVELGGRIVRARCQSIPCVHPRAAGLEVAIKLNPHRPSTRPLSSQNLSLAILGPQHPEVDAGLFPTLLRSHPHRHLISFFMNTRANVASSI